MRLGIYGGTFSPPHMGHIAAAKAFVDAIKLDKLLIIPTNIPPHKDFSYAVSAEDRLNMCRLAFSEIPCAGVSDMEIQRGGRSYTYMTLEALSSEENDIFLLCGTDMILTLDEWKRCERIFELATICYVRRECDEERGELIKEKVALYRERYGARIIGIDHTVLEMSSSDIRDAIYTGSDSSNMLTSNIAGYIRERGLYK